MDAQLHLIPTAELPTAELTDDAEAEAGRADWRLDPSTRAVGLRGIEQARAALRTAARHRHLDPDDHRASAA